MKNLMPYGDLFFMAAALVRFSDGADWDLAVRTDCGGIEFAASGALIVWGMRIVDE